MRTSEGFFNRIALPPPETETQEYGTQVKRVGVKFQKMKDELNMVSGRRSAQLERLLDKFHFDKGDIRGRNPYLEEKISKHKLEIDRYNRIMGQYDSKFV